MRIKRPSRLGTAGLVLGLLLGLCLCWLSIGNTYAQGNSRSSFLDARVHTLAVFKDGTVFVMKRGKATVGADGKVTTAPIADAAFGTVGVSSLTPGVTIKMLTASAPITQSRGPEPFGEQVRKSTGRPVTITRRAADEPITGELLGLRTAAEVQPVIAAGQALAKEPVMAIKQSNGVVSLVPLSEVIQCQFHDETLLQRDPDQTGQQVKISLTGAKEGSQVELAYYYLWKGVQWSPSYLLERQNNGDLRVQLRGEITNHLLDIEGAKLYLVVGVPNFKYLDHVSPLVAQKSLTQVTAAMRDMNSNHFSNAFVQVSNLRNDASRASPVEIRQPAPGELAPPTALPNIQSTDAGSLHLYEVDQVDLLKGERALINLADMKLGCRDTISWDIDDRRVTTATHTVMPADRAANPLTHYWLVTAGDTPLTTGPGLVMDGEIALSQDTIYYTPRGSEGRYKVGTSVGTLGFAEEAVIAREPGSMEVNDRQGHHGGKTFWYKREIRWIDEVRDLKITLTNGNKFPLDAEVTRAFNGVPEAQDGVTFRMLGGRTDTEDQVNRATWSIGLKPGESKSVTIRYTARVFTAK